VQLELPVIALEGSESAIPEKCIYWSILYAVVHQIAEEHLEIVAA